MMFCRVAIELTYTSLIDCFYLLLFAIATSYRSWIIMSCMLFECPVFLVCFLIKPNLCVCLYVSLFLMHCHSFEWICRQFGTWHPYILRMVMGRLANAARTCRLALHALSVYHCKSLPMMDVWLAGCKTSGNQKFGSSRLQVQEVSTAGAGCDRVLCYDKELLWLSDAFFTTCPSLL